MAEHDSSSEKAHEITIVINGRSRTITDKELTFEQVVSLAFDPPPTGDNVEFRITYRRGHGDKPEGGLLPGQSGKVKDGMVFSVSATDKS